MVNAGTATSLPRRIAPTPVRPGQTLDLVLAGILTLSTFFVHDLHYVLTAPYWVDESWVAISTRLPLSQAPQVTSVSPLGWTVLLRAAAFGGDQRQRLIPLIFSALTVLLAYLAARSLPWASARLGRLAGSMAGLAVLLAPSTLVRNDLKQYTADAAVTVAIYFLVSRLERSWSRGRLVALSALCSFGFLISPVALFVAAATFASLALVLLGRRRWKPLVEAITFGAGVAVVLGVLFLVTYAPHLHPNLTYFWRAYYLPLHNGLSGVRQYLHIRGDQMATYLGMGPLWLAVGLVVAGITTLIRIKRPMLAAIPPVLLVEMIVLSAAKKYPLFDERTSHFLTITFALYAAIGVAGLCSAISRLSFVGSTCLAVALSVIFIGNVKPEIRAHTIPPEDVRTPTEYVARHLLPTDVVLVNSSGGWGFGYYWPRNAPNWQKSSVPDMGFIIDYPGQARVIVASDRTSAAVATAVHTALQLAGGTTGARVWLVRIHVKPDEAGFYRSALRDSSTQIAPVSGCRLLLLNPPKGGGRSGIAYTVSAPIRPC